MIEEQMSDAAVVLADLVEQAGYLAAHAVWCISEEGPLIPYVGCALPDGTNNLTRFVDEQRLERAVERAREYLESNPEYALFATLVCDGYVTLADGKTDALILESRVYAEPALAVSMVVPYRSPGHPDGFAVHRPKFLSVLSPEPPNYEALGQSFFKGVDGHEQGAEVWSRHLDPSR